MTDEQGKLLDKLEALTGRVQELEDIEEIKSLTRNWIYRLSERIPDALTGSFCGDAILNINDTEGQGSDDIHRMLTSYLADFHTDTRQIIGQPVLSAREEKASGYWTYFLLYSEPLRWEERRLECDYLKVSGEWFFRYMRIVYPWPER